MMMTKSESIEAIEKARLSHIKQMEKIDAVLNGMSVENPTTVSKMKCDFGKWLYGDDKDFIASILGSLFYEQLDVAHENWHIEYAKIHALLFQEKKTGFFAKLFDLNKIDSLTIDKAKTYFVELEQTTNTLLGILEKSKRRMDAISESKYV